MKHVVILFVASSLLCSCGMMGAEGTSADGGSDAVEQDDCDGDDCGPTDEGPGDVDDEPVFIDTVVPDGLEFDGFCDHAPTVVKCMDHEECDDNIYCNGKERCGWFSDAYYCYQSSCYPCDSAPGGDFTCRPGVCLEDQEMCTYPAKDIDEDGYADIVCGGDDCDDAAHTVHPGASEACDGLDNDCDNLADEDSWKAAETPLRVSRDGSDVLDAAIGALADKWVVAWVDALGEQTSICVGRYGIEDLGGSAPAAPCFDTAGPAGELAIAMTGSSDFYVFWIENNESIMGRRMWHETRLEMDGAALIFGPEPAISDIDTALEPDGGHAGIFFKSDRTGNFEIHMIRTSLPGLAAAEETLRVSRAVGFSGHPSAAAGPEAYGVAWQDDRDGNMEIYFSTFGFAADSAGNDSRLTVAPGDSTHPSLTATPGGFFVAWMDESSRPQSIFASALDAEGSPVGYPASISDRLGAAEYPAALLDAREPDYPNQNMIAYIQRVSGEDNKILLTAAGPGSSAMDRGVELHATAAGIFSAVVSGEGDVKAALWIQGNFTEKELYFTILECM